MVVIFFNSPALILAEGGFRDESLDWVMYHIFGCCNLQIRYLEELLILLEKDGELTKWQTLSSEGSEPLGCQSRCLW